MQLASGFMQLAAAGRIGATMYIFIVFLRETFNILEITSRKNYISDSISNDIPPQIKILNTVIPCVLVLCSKCFDIFKLLYEPVRDISNNFDVTSEK